MCGRFVLKSERARLEGCFQLPFPTETRPRYNIAPSQKHVVIRAGDERNQTEWLSWGLVPAWSRKFAAKEVASGNEPKSLSSFINARVETALQKHSFRAAAGQRRCLIPADGFYEWRKGEGPSEPFFIYLESEQPFAMAGLWEPGGVDEDLDTFAILTTSANQLVANVHQRMPVILPENSWQPWLDANSDAATLFAEATQPFDADLMAYHPVNRRMNSPSFDDARCIEPAG